MKKYSHPKIRMNSINYGPNQTIRIMKLITLLILLSTYSMFANVKAQNISLNVRQAPLKTVLKEIEQQSGYVFWYKTNALNKAGKVNVELKGATLKEALDACFDRQPYTYEIIDQTILVKPKPKTIIERIESFINKINVSGKVIDEQGKPIPGVNISIKGSATAATTDNAGQYSIEAEESSILVFSYIGYDVQEIAVNQRKVINVRLKQSDNQLDQVQVIGYGTTTRRLSTSNVHSIKADAIARQPVNNPLLALQGRVPGLLINQTSGYAGSNVDVTVQGLNSMRSGNEPFYVIDGVPYTPRQINSGVTPGIFPGLGGSTMNFINPADIESVEILKDADATAIYGSRAANGAILITTKKGKAGQTKVDLNMQSGIGHITRRLKMMNTEEYLAMRREAFKNDGTTPGAADYDLNGTWDQSRYTDWQEELLGGNAHFTNAQASISGGTQSTQFLASAGYVKETTVLPGDYNDTKGNVHFNLNHHSPNQRFTFNLSTTYLKDVNKLPPVDLSTYAINLVPNAPALYTESGAINWAPMAGNPSSVTFDNPIALLETQYRAITNNLISNAIVGYQIIPGLQIKSSFGYNLIRTNEYTKTPQTRFSPAVTTNARSAANADKSIESYIVEPQLTYERDFSFGHFDLLLGSTFQQSKSDNLSVRGTTFGSDSQLDNISAASTFSIISKLQSEYRYSAIFSRINYRLKDRYIINLTARRDGSSRFGSENLFNNFYSAGGAWIFSEESFIKNSLRFLGFGKLRLSYGTTGNDQIGDYQFLNLYNNYSVAVPYQQTTGLAPAGHANPYLQWEETNKLNLGLDLGFFSNRLLFNINYFRNRSSNQLLPYPLPFDTGYNSITSNLPATVQNTGLEFLIDAVLVKAGDFKWEASFNLTVPKNKLVDFPGLAQSTLASSYYIGKSISTQKAYDLIGVNPTTGFYEFRAANGNVTNTPSSLTDQTVLINTDAKFYGGFSNTLSYKGFSFDFLFQFNKQTAKTFKFGTANPGNFFGGLYNQPRSILSYWKNPGDVTGYMKISRASLVSTMNSNVRSSQAAYGDASYIRLKNASLSYSLPQSVLQRLKLNQLKVFLQGQNLLTITKFEGGDPETRTAPGYPPLQVYTLGLQLTL